MRRLTDVVPWVLWSGADGELIDRLQILMWCCINHKTSLFPLLSTMEVSLECATGTFPPKADTATGGCFAGAGWVESGESAD